jgi:glycine/D-amino acid oxidase-like deaminating enzyme
MNAYDWIVVGGGITGAALGYELAKLGGSVLLLERHAILQGATRYSYGGIAYWSAMTELTQKICQESLDRYRQLSVELEADTQFRELDLLLTIDPTATPTAIADAYSNCLIPPKLISVETAAELEPLLDPTAIAAALHARHAHVDPECTANAYIQAMCRLGGEVKTGDVVKFETVGDRIQGVVTAEGETLIGNQIVICAGGFSRALLRSYGISVPCYFTHAELIETPAIDLRMQALVMAADLKRFQLEAEASKPEIAPLWDTPNQEIAPSILDAGAVQFTDGRLRIGQISRVQTNPYPVGDAAQSEGAIREKVGKILPTLQQVPGQWRACLVAFTSDRLPLVGAIPQTEGFYLFSGFSNPFALLPPLASRFARYLAGHEDDVIPQLSPARFVAG